jgi:hypothetical protein
MTIYADIVIETADRRRVLIVECKRMKETSPEQAARWRRNYVTHGLDSGVPYFLLASSGGLFLCALPHLKCYQATSAASSELLPADRGTIAPTTTGEGMRWRPG